MHEKYGTGQALLARRNYSTGTPNFSGEPKLSENEAMVQCDMIDAPT
jgi:hypothetical protein